MKPELLKNVTAFLNLHLKTQMNCFHLSQELAAHGFPGFAWFYQVQAEDEFMHQRRIINFLQGTSGATNYQLSAPDFQPFKITTPEEGLNYYIQMRQKTLEIAFENKERALKVNDYLVADFYDWFIKDYWSEISENQDLLDRVKMSPKALAGLDRRLGNRAEINPDKIIHPMKGFVVD